MSGVTEVDVVVVGAGFGGLCAVKRLRDQGMRVRAYETANDVGGTWHWNRYPGARCDVESVYYSYSFDPRSTRSGTGLIATPPSPRSSATSTTSRTGSTSVGHPVLDHDRLGGLGRDTQAVDGDHRRRRVGHRRNLVSAAGCLSAAQRPSIPGQDLFEGTIVHTSRWPRMASTWPGCAWPWSAPARPASS